MQEIVCRGQTVCARINVVILNPTNIYLSISDVTIDNCIVISLSAYLCERECAFISFCNGSRTPFSSDTQPAAMRGVSERKADVVGNIFLASFSPTPIQLTEPGLLFLLLQSCLYLSVNELFYAYV